MKFKLLAFGRKRGSIGCWYTVIKTVEAKTLEEAKDKLRHEYETRYVREA